MPDFFLEGNTPRRKDTIWRILQKILGALTAGGGLGGQEIYPAGTTAPTDPTKPALRYTGDPPTPMEQWDPDTQQWF